MVEWLGRSFPLAKICIQIGIILIVILAVKTSTFANEGQCKLEETYCKLPQGRYGCCPFPHAGCCTNEEYCCPFGYVCKNKTCMWEKRTPNVISKIIYATLPIKMVPIFRSNDNKCHPYFTHCQNDDYGQPECCPLPNAVCCNDKQHCCPAGSKCSSREGGCEWNAIITSSALTINFYRETSDKQLSSSAKTIPTTESGTPCPTAIMCPANNTCCLDSQVRFVCCPFKDAACCYEGTYCCPYGTYCVGEKTCRHILQ